MLLVSHWHFSVFLNVLRYSWLLYNISNTDYFSYSWVHPGHHIGTPHLDITLEHSWKIDGALISGVWDHAATEIPEMQQEDTEAHQYIMNVCTHHLMQYMYINITSIDISVNKWFRVASMREASSIAHKRKLKATRRSNKAMGCTVAVIRQGHLPTPQNWHCALTGSW